MFFCSAGYAQEHNDGPRGGKLKAVSFYRMEVVECYEYLEVYLYDLDMCAIRNNSLYGSVIFYFPDNTHISSKLFPYGADGFTAEIKQQCYERCEINISGVGLSLKALFDGFGENNEDCKRPEKHQLQN